MHLFMCAILNNHAHVHAKGDSIIWTFVTCTRTHTQGPSVLGTKQLHVLGV
jgi:hypothetical protein